MVVGAAGRLEKEVALISFDCARWWPHKQRPDILKATMGLHEPEHFAVALEVTGLQGKADHLQSWRLKKCPNASDRVPLSGGSSPCSLKVHPQLKLSYHRPSQVSMPTMWHCTGQCLLRMATACLQSLSRLVRDTSLLNGICAVLSGRLCLGAQDIETELTMDRTRHDEKTSASSRK
ncbi:unnamed protein product [Ostreobium quekettii]|uniref:Uncharacterized protein n=1 Tax=Ostreobium quekettii TaxID=121088 RepID=A0A8S1JEN5_9CHLO|nr:unnamed protein product [Ostreobium quekettii]|eukprot:evm.model.scf_739.2 EVM.evm.TU.scf_739.2   scf_739:15420-16509(+)